MNFKKLLLSIVILLFATSLIAQDYRYTEDQFATTSITSNVVYGTAPFVNSVLGIEAITTTNDLLMDIYLPDGDTNMSRPVIVFAHGGGFVIGNKQHDDMVALCESYAKKGYVTVSIDYRQGFHIIGDINMYAIRAVYRGLQDGKTAVRFLRANASTYGIDQSKVYFAGSSAGAFIGLHSIYMDELSEKPPQAGELTYVNATFPFVHTAPDLGGYDIGGNLSFEGEPDAVVSLWGAVQNTSLIKVENDESVFLVHGHDDAVVPFNSGAPFSVPLLDNVEGSNLIKNKLDVIGLTNNETYFVEGVGHEFYGVTNGALIGAGGNEYWDIIVDRMTTFLWNEHKPLADFNSVNTGLTVDFTDASSGALSWLWDFGDGTTSTLQNPSHTYASDGDYDVKLYIENDILSWHETTKTVNPETLSVDTFDKLDFSYYPNPVSNILNVAFNENHENIKVKIFNVIGQLVKQETFKNKSNVTLNIETFASNMYFMTIETDTKVSQIKIVKE